jgi:hypothetical protein
VCVGPGRPPESRRQREFAAAKARDRKAFELHGQFAYLNFPEDYGGS